MSNLNLKGLWIPIEILTDTNLSDKEKHIYSIIMFLSKENNYCYCTNSNISELLNISITQVSKLDEGVDGDTVVLVHEKYDGTYEVIDTTYDKTNHTITFNTSSFSNYAIASKKIENTTNIETSNKVDNTTNPETGDNIIIFSVIFVIALTGILVTFIINKKRVKNNK